MANFYIDYIKPPVLPDTTLCAIVRDEVINPAGGIKRFIESHVPYVEQAVIVDTGSVDGTRQALEEMQAQYPNLKVQDTKFEGYDKARNVSLKFAKTPRVLVLDADERFEEGDIETLQDFTQEYPANIYQFEFRFVYPNGSVVKKQHSVLSERLFDLEGASFYTLEFVPRGDEIFDFKAGFTRTAYVPVSITHFLPSPEALEKKKKFWYNNRDWAREQPAQNAQTHGWKERNPYCDSQFK